MITFDPAKDEANRAKHGLSLADAERFDLEGALVRFVERNGETRRMAFGDLDGRMHVLVYVVRGADVRIISLRKANKREQRYVRETR